VRRAPQVLRLANHELGFRTRQTKRMGDKPLARSAIYKLFADPFYYGWFEYPRGSGTWYKGGHEPMVTEEEFNRVQVLLGRNGSPRPNRHLSFAFTGLIRCGECGAAITADEKHQLRCEVCRHKFAYRNLTACPRCQTLIDDMAKPTFRHYTYYHCTKRKNPNCTQGSIEQIKLERQIEEFLSRIHISVRFRDWVIKHLRQLHEQEATARNEMIRSQQKAYETCVKRLDNLVRLKTTAENADGRLLSDEEYGKQRFELLKEKARLEELSRDTGHRVEQWVQSAEKIFEFACSAPVRFTAGDSTTKKEILASVGSNLTLKDKKLCGSIAQFVGKETEKGPRDFDRRAARAKAQKPPLCSF